MMASSTTALPEGASGDLEALEDRHAGRGRGRQRAAEARDGDLEQELADDRQSQHEGVDDAAAAIGLVPAVEGHGRRR